MFCIVNEHGDVIYALGGRLHIYVTEQDATKHLQESTLSHGKYSVVPYSSSLRIASKEIIAEPIKEYLTDEEESDIVPAVVKKKRKQRSDKGGKRKKKK